MMYFETIIKPHHAGFGEYDQEPPNGEGWEDEADLIAEMRSNEPDLLELGVDALPKGVQDIRGKIHNESGRIFALPYDDGSVRYFAVVAK